MNIRYRVTLTPDERHHLRELTSGGTRTVRQVKRAQILLAADAQASDERIAADVGVGTSTVYRTKQHFVEDGLARALSETPRPGAPRKLSASDEARLVAVACSAPPAGRARWTLDLLAGELVRLEPLAPHHIDDLFDACRDPEVFRWLSVPWPQTRAAMAAVVAESMRAVERRERVVFVQVERSSGRAVGATSYYEISAAARQLAVGYTWLGRPWWRSGINTEAKLLLLGRAFDELGAIRVTWHTDIRNERSQAAIVRLGAVREGVLRNHRIRLDGSFRDTVIYSMTEDEWPAARDRLRARLLAA